MGLDLFARILPEIDRQQLDKEGKKVEKKFSNLKFGGKFGVPKGLQGRGGGKQGGGLTNIFGKGAGGMMGKLAAITIVGEGILKGITRIVGFLAEASPMLKGVLKMLKFGVMMILKPIGDLLAVVLRPMARWLLQKSREAAPEMREAMETGDPGKIMETYVEEIWGPIFEDIANFMFNNFISGFQPAMERGFEKVTDLPYAFFTMSMPGVIIWIGQQFKKLFRDWFNDFFNNLSVEDITNLGSEILTWVEQNVNLEDLTTLGSKILTWIKTNIDLEDLLNMGSKLIKWIKQNIDLEDLLDLGTEIFTMITKKIGGTSLNVLKGFGDWLLQTIKDTITPFDTDGGGGGIVGDIGGFFDNLFKGLQSGQSGGAVAKSGLAVIHKGEEIVPKENVRQSSPVINIEISGTVYGMDDLESKIESVMDDYANKLRRI